MLRQKHRKRVWDQLASDSPYQPENERAYGTVETALQISCKFQGVRWIQKDIGTCVSTSQKVLATIILAEEVVKSFVVILSMLSMRSTCLQINHRFPSWLNKDLKEQNLSQSIESSTIPFLLLSLSLDFLQLLNMSSYLCIASLFHLMQQGMYDEKGLSLDGNGNPFLAPGGAGPSESPPPASSTNDGKENSAADSDSSSLHEIERGSDTENKRELSKLDDQKSQNERLNIRKQSPIPGSKSPTSPQSEVGTKTALENPKTKNEESLAWSDIMTPQTLVFTVMSALSSAAIITKLATDEYLDAAPLVAADPNIFTARSSVMAIICILIISTWMCIMIGQLAVTLLVRVHILFKPSEPAEPTSSS